MKQGKNWMLPSDAVAPLDGRTREYAEKLAEKSAKEIPSTPYTSSGAGEKAAAKFESVYKKSPEYLAFTPYRICPIGAHSDHQLGKITGFAIDKGIHIAYGPKMNGIIEIASLQFPKRAQWHVNYSPAIKQDDWADHLRGATIALNRRYPLRTGLCAIINGELPVGGLSSSAAVIITYLSALCHLNGIHLSAQELIDISKEAENQYVGVACGKLDQSCEIYCRKDRLLYLDILTNSFELIPQPPQMKPFEIAIFFSGPSQNTIPYLYNVGVDECRSAAYALKAFAGMEYRNFEETNLRDVPHDIYMQYKNRLPKNWAKRAEHWYTEFERVEQAVAAWKAGDIETFGRLSSESGHSSVCNWDVGSPELIKLCEIITNTPGVYGGRFSGTGFKGCCFAFIDPDLETEILEAVKRTYLNAFPHLAGSYSAHICHTADGIILHKEVTKP